MPKYYDEFDDKKTFELMDLDKDGFVTEEEY